MEIKDEILDESVNIRISKEDKKIWMKQAKNEGYRKLSTFIRNTVNDHVWSE